uniref:Regulatory protein SIR2 homolog 7 n=1 Tax=Octactis speculum TaxID=3111310 RepID=A0A6U3XY32_9STRA|mmetsp:Transcript_58651/g.79981  ORF Transcript_58651/g.79981 Transcript_58651/m.79981 type:complete len:331 (+) Transcript_58651:62-1054(+)|eukprot:CAMPEP_0185748256 /NCGR_PEP_ID=MMETSP1174-20130828/6924_1 /TAXON_ID=35687 /ORGANISM="Dictyocha speculum, Strain CCMP1381" /LENGTH=330 /DNA_ID=CAMNT_0028423817 /DNA_START=53 /DNA_END=1045 /DNA_ORIENTATION=+
MEELPRRSTRSASTRSNGPEALATLIMESKFTVFVTGAGISTNGGIRDYTGPNGILTEARKRKRRNVAVDEGYWDDGLYKSITNATPTATHFGIQSLVEHGFVDYVISQNEDGLHVRSGLDRENLSELHGNDFIELCSNEDCCDREVFRDFVTYAAGDTYKTTNPLGRHVTGRACPHCASPNSLLDTCVDFKEMPDGAPWGVNPVHQMGRAQDAMKRADLVVAWGSSLDVLANYFDPWDPESEEWGRGTSCRLAAVTMGRVCDEEQCVIKLDSDVDEVMRRVLAALQLQPVKTYDPAEDVVIAKAVPPHPHEPIADWHITRDTASSAVRG